MRANNDNVNDRIIHQNRMIVTRQYATYSARPLVRGIIATPTRVLFQCTFIFRGKDKKISKLRNNHLLESSNSDKN